MGYQSVWILVFLLSASEAFLSTCFSSTFLDDINRKVIIFEEHRYDDNSIFQYFKPLFIENRIYGNFVNEIFHVGDWRNFSFSTKLSNADLNSSLFNTKKNTVKDIVRKEVEILYMGWKNEIEKNEDSEFSNTWTIGSNLKNISKETKKNVVRVSRFLVLIMDEVLVTWNDILAEYLPEIEEAKGGDVEFLEKKMDEEWKSLLICFLDLFLDDTDGLLDVLMNFFPKDEIVSNLRQMLASVNLIVKDKSLGKSLRKGSSKILKNLTKLQIDDVFLQAYEIVVLARSRVLEIPIDEVLTILDEIQMKTWVPFITGKSFPLERLVDTLVEMIMDEDVWTIADRYFQDGFDFLFNYTRSLIGKNKDDFKIMTNKLITVLEDISEDVPETIGNYGDAFSGKLGSLKSSLEEYMDQVARLMDRYNLGCYMETSMVYKYGENFRLKTLDFSENEEMNKQARDIVNDVFDDLFLIVKKTSGPCIKPVVTYVNRLVSFQFNEIIG